MVKMPKQEGVLSPRGDQIGSEGPKIPPIPPTPTDIPRRLYVATARPQTSPVASTSPPHAHRHPPSSLRRHRTPTDIPVASTSPPHAHRHSRRLYVATARPQTSPSPLRRHRTPTDIPRRLYVATARPQTSPVVSTSPPHAHRHSRRLYVATARPQTFSSSLRRHRTPTDSTHTAAPPPTPTDTTSAPNRRRHTPITRGQEAVVPDVCSIILNEFR
ncbi:serine/arginine repetitive matrix protein 1-like [Procambarus clarkii]|uniref:serine/arginine repetitive matrix protein 1-like n=1 Tax=Procambarus clarkii TaxID=6728 RepID=UPI003742D1FD